MAERAGLMNVRAASGDALDLLGDQLPAVTALEAVHVYFPDPWPKARHHNGASSGPRSSPCSRTGCAMSGAAPSAPLIGPRTPADMLEVLAGEPRLANLHSRLRAAAHSPSEVTKFEARAVRDGREVFDLCFAQR